MKAYDIFIKQNVNNSKIEDIMLVKLGFNWWAFLFNAVWFMFNRLWLFSFLLLIYYYFVGALLSLFASKVLIILTNVIIGFEFENILVYRLKRENYYFVGISMGKDEDEAKINFLEQINNQGKNEGKIIF
jgi:hypothetical protein